MNDSALNPPPSPVPAPPRPTRRQRLTAGLRRAWRRPGRTLGFLVLLLVLLLALGGMGLLLWGQHHLNAARQAVALGHNRAAVQHLNACRRVRPNHPEVLVLCARVAWRSGNLAEADELLDRCWQANGESEALVRERLLLRAARGEVTTAALLQPSLQRGGAEAEAAREARCAGLLRRFHLDEAQRLLDDWLAAAPDSCFALLARGALLEMREGTSAALLAYRRVVELDPAHDEARLRLLRLLVQFRQGEEALAHARFLSQRLPEHADVAVRLAQALDLQGQAAEARQVLDECLARHPDHAPALLERGTIARRDGDAARAVECLERAVRLDPGDLSMRYQYGLALTQGGDLAEAARQKEASRRLEADLQRINDLVQKQLPATPDDPAVHHEIATIALRAGRPGDALRWFLNALEVDPAHLPTHRALAVYYQEAGNPILSARHRAFAQRLAGPRKP